LRTCALSVLAAVGADGWRGPAGLMKTVSVATPEQRHMRWPAHLPVGALRVVRWSAHYDETVIFYRDTMGLPVLETFQDSYGLGGTILGMPGSPVHLEIVRLADAPHPAHGLDQLVFCLPDAAARERITARLAAAGARPVTQIDYWRAHGDVTYQDPDGREVTGKGGSRGSCLSELWPVLHLAAEWAPEILGAQAEWRTWLLRGPPARWLPRAT
jgi:hypothetical protein